MNTLKGLGACAVLAGIALGPSLLGRFFPDAQAAIFPSTILPILGPLAQIGVILQDLWQPIERHLARQVMDVMDADVAGEPA